MRKRKLLRQIAAIAMSTAVAVTSVPSGMPAQEAGEMEEPLLEETVEESVSDDAAYSDSGEDSAADYTETAYADAEYTDTASAEGEYSDAEEYGADDFVYIEDDYTEDDYAEEPAFAEDEQDLFAEEAAVEEETDIFAWEEATEESAENAEEESFSGYVLMNIPYGAFYQAEGIEGVDAVTSATLKTYNTTMAGGSYHEGYDAVDPLTDAKILGVTYPVKVESLDVLAGKTQVHADDTATITVAAGKAGTKTQEASGKDLLFASGDYAYYVLDEVPANYKTLSVGEDGSFSFSAVANAATAVDDMTAGEIAYNGHHADVAFTMTAPELADATVTAVIVTADGVQYPLQHVVNVWRKTELGWNWGDIDGNGLAGKTITNITYYVQEGGVYSSSVNIPVKKHAEGTVTAEFTGDKNLALTGLPEDIANPTVTVQTKVGRGETSVVIAAGEAVEKGAVVLENAPEFGTTYTVNVVSDNYADISCEASAPEFAGIALVNIPYDVFYRNVLGVALAQDRSVDAFSSATTKKASYFWDARSKGNHASAYGEDSTLKGVQFPARISEEDFAILHAKGAAEDYYCGYTSETDPALFINITAVNDRVPVLDALSAEEQELAGASVTLENGSAHGDFMLKVAEDGGVLTDASKTDFVVYGAAVTTSEGTDYVMRHLENLYYKDFHEIAFSTFSTKTIKGQVVDPVLFADLSGKTISKVTFWTNAGKYAVNCEVEVPVLNASVSEVAEQIMALPEDPGAGDREQIDAARAAYDTLSDEQKDFLASNKSTKELPDVLEAAEEAVAKAEAAGAKAVEDQINALNENAGTGDAQAVADARAAYEALTDVQKALVAEAAAAKLEAAEKSVEEAKAAAEQAAKDAQAAKEAEEAKAAEKAAAQAAFALNVKAGAKNIPLQLKKNNKKIKTVTLAQGDSLASAVSSNVKAVKASVSGNTVVLKGLKNKGKATITVTTVKGAVIEFSVKVQKKAVKTKKIAVRKASVRAGESYDLGAQITPVTTLDKVTFTSSNKKIATVSKKGIVRAKKAGKVKITIKSGTKKKTVKLTITK